MDDDSHRWCWGRGNAARTRIITRSLVDTLSEYWCIYIYIHNVHRMQMYDDVCRGRGPGFGRFQSRACAWFHVVLVEARCGRATCR